jgi:hypothetical protein
MKTNVGGDEGKCCPYADKIYIAECWVLSAVSMESPVFWVITSKVK